MKNKLLLLFFIFIIIVGISVSYYILNTRKEEKIYSSLPQCTYSADLTQGLYGEVTTTSGNCMPGAGGNCTKRRVPNAKIIITAPKKRNDRYADSRLHSIDSSEILYQTKSNEDGCYELNLSTGEYSVFISTDTSREDYFCALTNGNGILCPVNIESNKNMHLFLDNNSNAAY